MVQSDSSVTTLGHSGANAVGTSKGRQSNATAEPDDKSWRSVDLLLTQDEWSSGDEGEDEEKSLSAHPTPTTETNPKLTNEPVGESKEVHSQQAKPSNDDKPKVAGSFTMSPDLEKSKRNDLMSPATRTLEALSQQSTKDLRYDMSHLESDTAATMLSLRGKSQSLVEPMMKESFQGTTSPSGQSAKSANAAPTQTAESSPERTNAARKGSTDVACTTGPSQLDIRDTLAKKDATGGNRSPQPQSRQQGQPVQELGQAHLQSLQSKQKRQEDAMQKLPVQSEQKMPEQEEQKEGPLDLTNYDTYHFVISEEGSLGITIMKAYPPGDILPSRKQVYCRVKKVAKGNIGYEVGLQEGDWFLQDTSATTLATYENIVACARSKERPINLYVARLKQSKQKQKQKEPTPETIANRNSRLSSNNLGKGIEDRKLEKQANPKPTSTKKQTKYETSDKSRQLKQKRSRNRDNNGSVDPDDTTMLPNKDKIVPYCNLCSNLRVNKKRKAVHHALCPKNSCFANSGARKLLRNIIAGVNMGCSACSKSYEVGRVNTQMRDHIVGCPTREDATDYQANNNTRLAAANVGKNARKKSICDSSEKESKIDAVSKKRTHDREKPPASRRSDEWQGSNSREEPKAHKSEEKDAHATDSMGSTKSNHTHTQPTIPTKQQTEHRSSAQANKSAPHDSPKRKNSRPLEVCTLAVKKRPFIHSHMECKEGQSKRMRGASEEVNNNSDSTTNKQSSPTSVREQGQSKSTSVQERPNNFYPTQSHVNSHRKTTGGSTAALIDFNDGHFSKSKWISCENPWGIEGHLENDVVLMTPSSGLGHYETLLQSERFESYPFSVSSKYRGTHNTPEEGFHVIRLKRDPLAVRPWGFKVHRHEFGGGCLVKSVDPLSPAEAAVSYYHVPSLSYSKSASPSSPLPTFQYQTFIAGSPDESHSGSALRVNDMVIAVNNMETAGMTEVGFELELETSGPCLALVVSRYKFAAEVLDSVEEAEKNIIGAIENAMNDDRQLGWVDLGAAPAAKASLLAVSTNHLEEKLSLQSSRECQANPAQQIPLARRMTKSVSFFDKLPTDGSDEASVQSNRAGMTECESQHLLSHSSGCLLNPNKELNRSTCSYESSSMADEEDSQLPQMRERHEITREPNTGPTLAISVAARRDKQIVLQEKREVAEQDKCAPKQISIIGGVRNDFGADVQDNEKTTKSKSGETIDAIEEHDDDNDGNPALGCVCGEIHNSRYVVFWIQCDECHAWYNVARKCVGFSEEEAEGKGKWSCWACSLSDASTNEDDSCKSPSASDDGYTSNSPEVVRNRRRRKSEPPEPVVKRGTAQEVLENGTIVEVDREGSDLFGGIARVIDAYLSEDGERMYSVKYVIKRYTEHNILAEFVVPQGDIYN